MRIEKHREQFLNLFAQNAPGCFYEIDFSKAF